MSNRLYLKLIWVPLLAAVLLALSAAVVLAAKNWSPTQGGGGCNIQVAILHESDPILAPGETVCLEADASDVDYWTEGQDSGSELDDFEDVPPNQYGYTWSCTGGSFDDIHDAAVVWTAPTTPGTYTVTCLVNDRPIPLAPGDTGSRDDGTKSDSITFTVYDPICEVAILEPTGAIGGVTPVRLRVRTRLVNIKTFAVKEHEDTAAHSWEWSYLEEGEDVESEETDADYITTTIYKYTWDTLTVHNGPHVLRVESRYCPVGSDQSSNVTTERALTVRNLTVTASPDYLMYDPSGPSGNVINYVLDDGVIDSQTKVKIIIYRPSATFGSEQAPVRSVTLTQEAGPDRSYVYTWDGKDNQGRPQPKGVYLYQICASQQEQDDSDSDKSSWTIKSISVLNAGYNPSTGITTVRVRYKLVPGWLTYDGQSASEAKVQVFDPDWQLVNTTYATLPIALNQSNVFPDFGVSFGQNGKYLFLVSASDGDMAYDRAHRQKAALQLGYVRTIAH